MKQRQKVWSGFLLIRNDHRVPPSMIATTEFVVQINPNCFIAMFVLTSLKEK